LKGSFKFKPGTKDKVSEKKFLKQSNLAYLVLTTNYKLEKNMKALPTLTTTALAFAVTFASAGPYVTLPSNHDLPGKKVEVVTPSEAKNIASQIAESMDWTIRNIITDQLNTRITKVNRKLSNRIDANRKYMDTVVFNSQDAIVQQIVKMVDDLYAVRLNELENKVRKLEIEKALSVSGLDQ